MLLPILLVDTPDPRYGGAPDPDEERRKRWESMDRKVVFPFVGSVSCLIVGAVTDPALTIGLNVVAVGLCYRGARAAMPRRRKTA